MNFKGWLADKFSIISVGTSIKNLSTVTPDKFFQPYGDSFSLLNMLGDYEFAASQVAKGSYIAVPAADGKNLLARVTEVRSGRAADGEGDVPYTSLEAKFMHYAVDPATGIVTEKIRPKMRDLVGYISSPALVPA